VERSLCGCSSLGVFFDDGPAAHLSTGADEY
jgi:hypothetical protein